MAFTAFASTAYPVTARLVVHRVRDRARLAELFPVWRYHPFVIERIRGWIAEGLGAGEIAVFAREGRVVTDVVRALIDAELPAVEVASREDRADCGDVRVMTMHRAKGLEFRALALPRMGAAEFPPPYVHTLGEEDAPSAERTERNLLYVAGSRARERLWISWTGQPSPLLPARD